MASSIPTRDDPSAIEEALSYGALPPVTLPRSLRLFVIAAPLLALAYAIAVLVAASSAPDHGFMQLNGVRVLSVDRGSAAEAAGLRAGDVILEINGESTATALERIRSVRALEVGDPIALVVDRGGERLALATYYARESFPVGSTLTTILGVALLLVALYAGRGRWRDHPRTFLRSTVVYVIFLAGLYSLEVVLASPWLGPPWSMAIVLAAPVTCHFMMKFPAGLDRLGGRRLVLLYAPPIAVGLGLIAVQLSMIAERPLPRHAALSVALGVAAGVLSAIYLTAGAVIRVRRIRRERDEIDPSAIRWLKLNGVLVALPFCCGLVWVLIDRDGFLGGGFKTLAAVTVIGGSLSLLMAMMRISFGQLDRYWRRSSGYIVAVFAMAAAYLGLLGLGVIGNGAETLSATEFRAAALATIAAAVIFGPLRARLQRFIDEHIGRHRARARRLLREASEAAITTLDVAALQTGVVHRVRAALGARGAAIYIAGDNGSWRREAWAGHSPLPREIAGERARRLDLCVAARAPREIDSDVIAVPLPVEVEPAALVVAPSPGTRFDEEERDLLHAAGAGLAVAIGNARAHTALQKKSEELRRQVEVAEERRREIARLKERLEEENRALIGELASRRGRAPVIGAGLKPTFELVQKVARTSASVLVCGETGVGKELVARAIHVASSRRDKPFIVVDCGAISPALFESTLFGHIRGAFTGAVRDSQGAFRAADGGTIFLDEIGELPAELQPKLLRVLQEREVHPVGVARPVAVDVRVISGTNRDLVAEVEAGNFREDLLYRLQVVEICVPPLRQRRGDIEALAEHFLAVAAARAGRPQKRLAPDAMQSLVDHDWPGNVRELEHTLEAAAVYAEDDEIRASDLPIFDKVFRKKGRRAISDSGIAATEGGAPRSGLRETLEGLERARLIEALEENRGNKSATARALGMSRGALLRRLKRYEIDA